MTTPGTFEVPDQLSPEEIAASTTHTLERERPRGTADYARTDGYLNMPRPDALADIIAIQETAKVRSDGSVVPVRVSVGHVAFNQVFENPPAPQQ